MLPDHCSVLVPCEADSTQDWILWDSIRRFCSFNSRLDVSLSVSSPGILEQWYSEPVRTIILSTTLFSKTKKYPGIQPATPQITETIQDLCKLYFSTDPSIKLIINEASTIPAAPFESYIHLLFNKISLAHAQLPTDEDNVMSRMYQDFLQSPLQPLAHHLESATYQVFERDAAKYEAYQLAVYRALLDLPQRNRYAPPAPTSSTDAPVVMVVGAGRGPIVSRVLAASVQAGLAIRVYAVEKNPGALVVLNGKRGAEWADHDVRIVRADMRAWSPPEMADIIVSELLGSFGDNEVYTRFPRLMFSSCRQSAWMELWATVSNQRAYASPSLTRPTSPRFPRQGFPKRLCGWRGAIGM